MAATILEEIAAYAGMRVAEDMQTISYDSIRSMAMSLPGGRHRFLEALKKPGLSLICEVKKASPSKGIIDPEFDYRQIAKTYAQAGADGISCLTEPRWFLGSDKIFTDIRADVKTPMIRKDFTVDAYQIYQAKTLGADAVLLICALMDEGTLTYYLDICEELGIDALVETHDEKEIQMAVSAGAKIIGVNNRNLKDFSVNFDNARQLRHLIPEDRIYVAESGVTGPEDVAALKAIGADAVLMGEVLMRSKDPAALLKQMREA